MHDVISGPPEISARNNLFVQQYKLNEVHNGGLSSYSLVSMVVAHLISEGYTIDGSVPSLDPSALDLGKLLWGFLERYGNRFDYEDQAVSVREVQAVIRLRNYIMGIHGIQSCYCAGRYFSEAESRLFSGSSDISGEGTRALEVPTEEYIRFAVDMLLKVQLM